jgi:hypothetical protein
MPRLSLYRPEKSKDYTFTDRTIYEMFQIGGVDTYIHKYIGPENPNAGAATATQPKYDVLNETNIQDLLFLENRDRKYDTDVYVLRGHFQVQDIDFNLSQFGLFLQNDTVFMTVHINNSVDVLGRKVMAGDVFELPNLKDEYALNDFSAALKRFYVVEDVNRAAEGFSATWYPHLYRIKLKPIIDSQEFKDILDRPMDEDSYRGVYEDAVIYYPGQTVKHKGVLYECIEETSSIKPSSALPGSQFWKKYQDSTIRDLMSTYEREMQINDAVIKQAEADAPLSGFDTTQFYTLTWDKDTGKPAIHTTDATTLDATTSISAARLYKSPIRDGYDGYLVSDGVPPNGEQFGFGLQFPMASAEGDFFLRTDFMPNRLFRYDGSRWVKFEDSLRMTLTNDDTRQTRRLSFINNTEISGIDKIATDIVSVNSAGEPEFSAGQITTAFTIVDSLMTITTNLPYADNYGIELWVNEESKFSAKEILNASDKLAFSVDVIPLNDSKIRYSVFNRVVEQRQPISKALRKIKAEADE